MIKDSDIDHAVRFSKNPLHEWTVEEYNGTKDLLLEQQNNFNYKIVVALCVYNEEQFLEDTLNSCLDIVDLDGIHVLDGAWKHGGDSPKSTDHTHTIVDNFALDNPDINVTYSHGKSVWNSEGEKRNEQLRMIERMYGKAYILILDGDETIHTNTGQTRHWMRHELQDRFPQIGVVRGFGNGSKVFLEAPRLIPTEQKYHYHTEKPMIIHDNNHKTVIDYEWNWCERSTTHLFPFNNFRIINHWNQRGKDRLVDKQEYVEKVFNDTHGECKWTN